MMYQNLLITFMKSCKLTTLLIIFLISLSVKSNAQWVQTNGPGGGTVYAIYVGNNGKIYAGIEGQGIYLSSNNGMSWLAANKNMENTTIDAITSNEKYVFAGDGAYYHHIGIYRSSNSGSSWELTTSNIKDTISVTSLTAIGDTIIAGLYSPVLGYKSGILMSTNNGENWINPDSNFTAIVTSLFYYKNHLFAGTAGGLLVSTNMGKTWENTGNGLSHSADVMVSLGNDLFVTQGDKGIYKSTDFGKNWTSVTGSFNDRGIIISLCTQGQNIFAGSGTVLNGSGLVGPNVWQGVLRSSDNGNTWEFTDTSMTYSGVLSLAASDSTLFAGTNNGINVSYNKGKSWNFYESGLPPVTSPLSLIYSNSLLLAGLEGGVSISTNSGVTWNTIDIGLQGVRTFSNPSGATDLPGVYSIQTTNGGDFLAATESGLYRLNYNSLTWDKYGTGLPDSALVNLFKTNYGLFTVSAGGTLFSSTNDGNSWVTAGQGIPAGTHITSLVVLEGILFVATSDGLLYKSLNGGLKWFSTANNLNIDALGANGDYIFANTYIFYSYPGRGGHAIKVGNGIFKSNDFGNTWMPVDSGLTKSEFYPTIKSFKSINGLLFAIGDGIYLLSDKQTSWVSIDTENLFPEATSLASDGNNIFVGSIGKGVWRASLESLNIDTSHSGSVLNFKLSQNFPNPFNTSTIISYQLLKNTHVTLKVYDILGREIQTIVNEERLPGTYNVEFDGGKIASGVYFYQLQAGSFTDTKKFILMK